SAARYSRGRVTRPTYQSPRGLPCKPSGGPSLARDCHRGWAPNAGILSQKGGGKIRRLDKGPAIWQIPDRRRTSVSFDSTRAPINSRPARRPYPSDLTDAQWRLVEPLLPPAPGGGRPRTIALREVVDAIVYVGKTGCPWRALPHDFPPEGTV